jgi:DNA-binding FadR family transcriptional regulator
MTELAACRATDEERAEIAALAAQFLPDMELVEFRRLDRAFHSVLARASHNPLLAEVYAKVLVALFESDEWSTMLASAPRDAIHEIIKSSSREHREIAARIANGDPVASLEAMADHLDTVEARIVSGLP